MGIIKDIIGAAAIEAAKEIGGDVASNVVKATDFVADKAIKAVDKTEKAMYKAIDITADAAHNIIEASNESMLKKQAKTEECSLIVKNNEPENWFYCAVDNKDVKYKSLKEDKETLNVYSDEAGKLFSIKIKRKNMLFSNSKKEINYKIESGSFSKDVSIEIKGKKAKISGDLKDWIFTGDIYHCNYSIINLNDGTEIARISKKNKSASAFLVSFNGNQEEPLVFAVSILAELTKEL